MNVLLLEVGSWLLMGLFLGMVCSNVGSTSFPPAVAISAGLAGSLIGGSIGRLSSRKVELLRYSLPALLFAVAGASLVLVAVVIKP